MAETLPTIAAAELARRLEAGEPVQLLDVRAPDKVAAGRVALGAALQFRALPNSELFRLPALDPLRLDSRRPVAVICGHGNSSRTAAAFLRHQGVDAYSVDGGMAAWECVYVTRELAPTPAIDRVIQVDRVGKGCLSYVLVSDGEAVIVDPGRHAERYRRIVEDAGATPAAVIDTHAHADYLSGAVTLARDLRIPYFLHADDTRSPYDDTPARLECRTVGDGDRIAFGRAVLRVEHVPGHTLGSVTLLADGALALTGDFIFVRSIGRPDLGGQGAAWAKLLWRSLERARGSWAGDLVVLPAHYSTESERRDDRAVAGRFDAIRKENEPVGIENEATFLAWIAARQVTPPPAYRAIKLANLGLVPLSPEDAELLEFGPNQCAVG
ncbi:MAG TPA: MBL fold metallo-hydrolase [Gemmatimonadales bacterium]|nr:MBL fold metallo-hydrolase [Gemmatimonadales bacterium]